MTACACCGSPLPPPSIRGPDRLHGTPGTFLVSVCPSCGTGRTLPVVLAADLAAFYPSDYIAHGPDAPGGIARIVRAWLHWSALRTPALTPLRRRLPGRAVDIGCGRGDLGALLLGRGWTVTGVEPGPDACAAARARGIDAREGTLDTVELERGAYDVTLFIHALEHTVEPVDDLRKVADALRPGGLVAISVPHFGGWQARRFGSRWFHLDLPRHRHHFTRDGLAEALRAAGLQPQRMATTTSAAGLASSVLYAARGGWRLRPGMPCRLAIAGTQATWPVARLADLLHGGDGDILHAVARRL